MIYALSTDKTTLIIFVTPKDVKTIQSDRTLFVDDRHFNGEKVAVERVVLAHAPSDHEAIALLDQAARGNPQLVLGANKPAAGEGKCRGCNGLMPVHLVIDGQCGPCWRDAYKRLLGE